MLIQVDEVAATPVYRQIADEVRRCLAVGVLRPNEALPGVRVLASQLKVNANTVQHAYQVLEAEGVVEVRRGRGTFALAPAQKESATRQLAMARSIAERMLREGYRHGLLPSDLIRAITEIAPRPSATPSGASGEDQI